MRAVLDKLISWTGLALAAVLLIAGGLLTWANTFIGDQVDQQLTQQGITMPEGEALASLPKEDAEALEEYAGSELNTGPEAKAYADHYILAHMNAASDGRTYQEVSSEFLALDDEAKASEEGQALGGLRQTLFMGNTLRGLLLYGYAFATIGTIAGYAALAAFLGAFVLLALAQLGMRHARRTVKTEERQPELATACRPASRRSRGPVGHGPTGLRHLSGPAGRDAQPSAAMMRSISAMEAAVSTWSTACQPAARAASTLASTSSRNSTSWGSTPRRRAVSA